MHAAAALLPALAAGALVAISGDVPECDAYALQLNTLFPAAPGTEYALFCYPQIVSGAASNPYSDPSSGVLVFFGSSGTAAATRVAEFFENTTAVNITANWTAARVARVGSNWNRTSAECPCEPALECAGTVGNVSTCVPAPLPFAKTCYDGASATCGSLIAGGLGALGGGLLAALYVAYSPPPQ